MDGLDQADSLQAFPLHMLKKICKLMAQITFWMMDVFMISSWIIAKAININMSTLDFTESILTSFVASHSNNDAASAEKRVGVKQDSQPAPHTVGEHWPTWMTISWCAECYAQDWSTKKTCFGCEQRGVRLCVL